MVDLDELFEVEAFVKEVRDLLQVPYQNFAVIRPQGYIVFVLADSHFSQYLLDLYIPVRGKTNWNSLPILNLPIHIECHNAMLGQQNQQLRTRTLNDLHHGFSKALHSDFLPDSVPPLREDQRIVDELFISDDEKVAAGGRHCQLDVGVDILYGLG